MHKKMWYKILVYNIEIQQWYTINIVNDYSHAKELNRLYECRGLITMIENE